MGMSADLEAAIAEGATLVRVGTAIFGPGRGPPKGAPAHDAPVARDEPSRNDDHDQRIHRWRQHGVGAASAASSPRGAPVASFRVVEPHAEARARLAAAYPGIALFEAAGDAAIAGADIVVLAVKPQQMRAAAAALAPCIAGARRPVVLSIAAGIRIGDLARWLGGSPRIVRAMPNTPALIGRGISGVFAAAAVDAAGRALAAAVLEAAGEVVWVDAEEMLDAVTAVSGSGPAYVFYFLEALEAAARGAGLRRRGRAPARVSRRSTARSRWRSASEHEPAMLRAQVTSKGGTTERALAVLEAAGVKAAHRRRGRRGRPRAPASSATPSAATTDRPPTGPPCSTKPCDSCSTPRSGS